METEAEIACVAGTGRPAHPYRGTGITRHALRATHCRAIRTAIPLGIEPRRPVDNRNHNHRNRKASHNKIQPPMMFHATHIVYHTGDVYRVLT